jgi:hypothetical protein
MAKLSQIYGALEKLYGKRDALNKQIADAEKKLVTEAEAVKPAVPAKKPAPKKAVAKKPRAKKPATGQ